MKKYYLITGVIAGLFFTSCTKDFECTCTATTTTTSGGVTNTTTSEPQTVTIKNTSKAIARDNCYGTEYTNEYTDWNNNLVTTQYSSECELN